MQPCCAIVVILDVILLFIRLRALSWLATAGNLLLLASQVSFCAVSVLFFLSMAVTPSSCIEAVAHDMVLAAL